jgi:hypothetical protein
MKSAIAFRCREIQYEHSLREGGIAEGIELFICRVVYGKQKIFSWRFLANLSEAPTPGQAGGNPL